MKILAACAAGALAFVIPTSTAFAQDAATAQLTELQLAQQIVDRGFPDEERIAIFTGVATDMMSQIRASLPSEARKPAVDAILDAHMERVLGTMDELLAVHMDPLMAGLVTAYSETFTREELEGLHTFIMSPAGEGFLARTATMMAHPAFAEANQEYMSDFMARLPSLQQQLQTDLMRALQP